MTLTLTNTGTSPLVKLQVQPFVRENLATRACYVRVDDGSNVFILSSNARLRMNLLLAVNSTSARRYRAATKDHNDVWSELNDYQSLTFSNFSSGSANRSIGSASSADVEIEEPQVTFPELSIGSGYMYVHRTILDEGFYEESTRSQSADPVMAFTVSLNELDQEQSVLLQRWFKTLNGPFKPFYFDFDDPAREDDVIRAQTRLVVRFENPQMAEQLFGETYSNFSFTLIEQVKTNVGGAV